MGQSYFLCDSEMWTSFEAIVRVATALLKSFSQIALAFALIRRHASAPLFFAIFVVQLLIGIFGYDELWGKSK